MNRFILMCALLLAACEDKSCVNADGDLVVCGAIPDRPIRYCADPNGIILDDGRCDSGFVGGIRWVYYYHYYTPGQAVVIHDSVSPPSHGYVTYRSASRDPSLRPLGPPPRVSGLSVRTEPRTAQSPTRTESRSSSLSVRTSPSPASPRISSSPIRTTPSPVRMSSPRISTVRAR
jgi:hypothetical protein